MSLLKELTQVFIYDVILHTMQKNSRTKCFYNAFMTLKVFLKICNVIGTNGKVENSFKLSQSAVETWWPNEYGKQSMYLLNVEFTGSTEISTKVTQVAFRCQMTTLYQVSKWCQQTVH